MMCLLGFQFLQAQKTLTPSEADSKVHFVIRNFGIKTGGDLSGLKGIIRIDLARVADWSFDVTVNATTINTSNNTRDNHLRKTDYFDVTRFPLIRIKSTKITTTDKPGWYLFNGDLTIKDITKPISFLFRVNKWGEGYQFAGEFTMNRLDFGVGESSISLADNLKVSLSVFAK